MNFYVKNNVYYCFSVLKQKQRSLEQQAIVQQAINRQSIQTAPWQQHLHQIQDTSQEQIRQSEQNLAAQHQLLLQQQQVILMILLSNISLLYHFRYLKY